MASVWMRGFNHHRRLKKKCQPLKNIVSKHFTSVAQLTAGGDSTPLTIPEGISWVERVNLSWTWVTTLTEVVISNIGRNILLAEMVGTWTREEVNINGFCLASRKWLWEGRRSQRCHLSNSCLLAVCIPWKCWRRSILVPYHSSTHTSVVHAISVVYHWQTAGTTVSPST